MHGRVIYSENPLAFPTPMISCYSCLLSPLPRMSVLLSVTITSLPARDTFRSILDFQPIPH